MSHRVTVPTEKRTGRPAGKTAWRVCFGVLTALFAAVLELGKHTLAGWGIGAAVLGAFYALRARGGLKQKGRGVRLLSWGGLLAALAAVLWVSRPPVRPVPAVAEKDPEVTGVIHVAQGDLTGVYTKDRAVEVYTGIPYAQPPVGELRWKEPQPAKSWDGILAADRFAPMSMQTQNAVIYSSLAQIIGYHDYQISLKDNYREPVSEDSLYLNIWKPAGNVSGCPVLVYVHGGSLQTGQPWYADYSGEGLARQGCVVVNMGYRLGIFGFFADPELAAESLNGTTGNYGLLDQIEALRWVQENIAAFGGDPGNVTLAGESAGSACVTALCTSPLAKGLFRRVLAESSTVTAPEPAHSFRSLADAFKAAEETKERLGVRSIEELRALPAEKIAGELSVHHHITVDGYVLTETPFRSYQKGIHNEEAQLQGYNREEAAPFILFGQANLKNYEEKIRRAFPGTYADEVLALYPASTDAEAKRNWADIYSAVLFSYGHRCWARQAAQNGIPAYTYLFTKTNGRLGCWHSGEEVYFYGNIPAGSRLYDEADRDLSRIITGYVVNFMKTGDPNGEGLPAWPAFNGSETVQELGETVGPQTSPFAPVHEVLDRMYQFRAEE